MIPEFIPSPPTGVWQLGPVPIRAYAICILIGIFVGLYIGGRRWRARGGSSDTLDTAVFLAIPLGIVGARIYHVITDYQLDFGPGRRPIEALYIWNGGLGIWGAVALGALGVYLVCRRRHASFPAMADALAPGLAIAQGIGRLGNWFNQELFGRPTTVAWALQIDPQHRPAGYADFATFHPTFLYELLWTFLIAGVLIWADRRFRLGRGKVFALYVVLYTLGRFWIEGLRIDKVNEVGGFRLNEYTSVVVFVLALAWLGWLIKFRPGREDAVEVASTEGAIAGAEGGAESETAEGSVGADGADAPNEKAAARPATKTSPNTAE